MRSTLFLSVLLGLSLVGCQPLEVQRDPTDLPDDDDTGAPPVETDADEDGWSVEDGDCNDADPLVNPGQDEVCDSLDNDCSGEPDDVTDNVWYLDEDGDGYGGEISLVDGCEVDSTNAWVGSSDDCDDGNAEINPGATEYCNDVDDNCDGEIDEDDAIDVSAWFADEDGDGYGDPDDWVIACFQPVGFVGDWSDCNDADPVVHPNAIEICDGLDNDCNLFVDEGLLSPYYPDVDTDGWGDDLGDLVYACAQPAGSAEVGGDCDDTDASVNPGAVEICDGLDNDCNGSIDPDSSVDATFWYDDGDGDGYGDAFFGSIACAAPTGTVADWTDCDDNDDTVNPGAFEVCNSVDDDCDSAVDPSTSSDAGSWYLDADSDSYGDASASFVSCGSPSGYVADATDCDDGDSASYPGATEVCDGADNDCDGVTDPDSSSDASTWYDDGDGDGYGDAFFGSIACAAPTGTVADWTDCDDSDSSVFPDATEYCDEQDNDCDGDVDEDVGETFYADTDGDGYGNAGSPADACSVSSGYSANADDCDDSDAAINPDAVEICDGLDNDCNGSIDPDSSVDATFWYDDGDGDGWGDAFFGSIACVAPTGTVADWTDCDDNDDTVNPGATEVCDTVDNDCDGNVDVGAVDETTWYPDTDGDGSGNASGVTVTQCDQPSGYVADSTDCDDGDSASYPGATEYCDGADNDCDGVTDPDSSSDASTWYGDVDGDGFGDASSSSVSCSAPSGSISDATDCDDTDEYVNPSMLEVCGDTADNDCDGDTDGSPCVTEGAYEGDFAITLTETTGYALGSDSCEGTVSLTVDTTADPMISGTAECAFVGGFSAYITGTQTMTVEGDFATDLLPYGTIDSASFGWGFDWDDNGSTDTTLDGAFDGSDTYSILTFDYDGSFETDYTP